MKTCLMTVLLAVSIFVSTVLAAYDVSTIEKAQEFLMNLPPAISNEQLYSTIYCRSTVKTLLDFEASGIRALNEFALFRSSLIKNFPEKIASSNDNEIVFKLDTPGLTGTTSISVKPTLLGARMRSYKSGDIKILSKEARLGKFLVLLDIKGITKTIEYVVEDGAYRMYLDDAFLAAITRNSLLLKDAAGIFAVYRVLLEQGVVKKDTIDTLIIDCVADYTEIANRSKNRQ